MITTVEAKLALGEEFADFDLLYAVQEETHPRHSEFQDYMRRRQLGRLCRLTSGSDPIYVFYENIPEHEMYPGRLYPRFQQIYWPKEGESETIFYRQFEGHGEFLYFEGSSRSQTGVSKPEDHFVNWADFPELHDSVILFLDHECPQKPENYIF